MKRIQNFLEKWNEVLGLPLAVLAFLGISSFTWYQDQSGSVPSGVLQMVPWAAVYIIAASFIAYHGTKLNFPGFYRAFIEFMQQPTAGHQEAYKRQFTCTLIYLGIYFLLFFVSLALMLLLLNSIR